MSIKSFIQIIILIIILVILGSVYFQYFSKDKIIIEETTEKNLENEKLFKNLEDKINDLEEKNIKLKEEIQIKIDEINKDKLEEQKLELENRKLENEKNLEEKKKLIEAEQKLEQERNLEEKKKLIEAEQKLEQERNLLNEEKKSLNKSKKELIQKEKKEEIVNNKKNKIKNTVKDAEYISRDKKGNKFRLLATSAKSNKKDNTLLDLNNVRGVITSDIRDPIYIVSDFGQYNTSNFNSQFYQNVIINYMDKEITCENFDIHMETNTAIAYNNVIVTDPKSIMKAGIITFDLETKDININPVSEETKVKVLTN